MSSCPIEVTAKDGVTQLYKDEYGARDKNEFSTGCLWSPSGTHLLETRERNKIALHKLSPEVMDSSRYYHLPDEDQKSKESVREGNQYATTKPLQCVLRKQVGEAVYDTRWYPLMNDQDPITCCFATTSKDQPIHLWDMYSGISRASYRCYDQYDELESASCLSFNVYGNRVYAGLKSLIRCFDLTVPGRDSDAIPTSTSKKDVKGVRGIISCIQFNLQHPNIYAAGTYTNNVLVLQENHPASDAMLEIRDLPFAVTHLSWAPDTGNYLWIGGRNHDDVWCYDIRHTRRRLGSIQRSLSTNQRVVFDIDPWGRHLATGDDRGNVLIYDTSSFALLAREEGLGVGNACVNSVRFHPYCALLGVTAGQRVFENDDNGSDNGDDDDDDFDDDHDDGGGGGGEVKRAGSGGTGGGLSLCSLKSETKVMPQGILGSPK